MTAKEAAYNLNVSLDVIYAYCSKGVLKAVQHFPGARVQIDDESVNKLASRAYQGPSSYRSVKGFATSRMKKEKHHA